MRSLNKVQLIGNMTRDPEMRYTRQGTAVCTLALLLTGLGDRWRRETGRKPSFIELWLGINWRSYARNYCLKAAEFSEGRLQTRQWIGQDGQSRQATEIVIEDMIILDNKRQGEDGGTYARGTGFGGSLPPR